MWILFPLNNKASMLHQTKGIVLRQIKYAETSVIVTVYTSYAGRQAYMVGGVRKAKAKHRIIGGRKQNFAEKG